jgi:hypothetical protein
LLGAVAALVFFADAMFAIWHMTSYWARFCSRMCCHPKSVLQHCTRMVYAQFMQAKQLICADARLPVFKSSLVVVVGTTPMYTAYNLQNMMARKALCAVECHSDLPLHCL